MLMKVSIDELVIYAVYQIYQSGEECTFERLVYECFTLFPNDFGFKRYPQWPDSARIDKSWLRCRTDKGWLIGSVKEGFKLTDLGFKMAERTEKRLKINKLSPEDYPRKVTKDRERYDSILRNIRESEKFQEFANRPDTFSLSEMNFRQLIGCTLETPLRVIKQNLQLYRYAAQVYGDTTVTEFLDACETLMSDLLGIKPDRKRG
jgi:hypothetical protein